MGEYYSCKDSSHVHDSNIRAIKDRKICNQIEYYREICLGNSAFSCVPEGWEKSSNIIELESFLQLFGFNQTLRYHSLDVLRALSPTPNTSILAQC